MKKNFKDIIYLNIAGFVTKIVFFPTERFWLKNKFKNNLLTYYKGFIEKNFSGKATYHIEIKEKNFIKFFFKKNNKNYLLNFYCLLSKNKIETYYQIEFIQFRLILRDVIQNFLSENQGSIFHASGNIINGGAFLFLAPSGGGKSTATTLLSDEFKSIASDTIIIRKEKVNYFVYQTPFLEKDIWVKKDKTKYPLFKIFFIKKSDFFRIERIFNKQKIINLILKQIFFNKRNQKNFKQIKFVLEFVSNFNNFYYLYFKKEKKGLINILKNF